MGTSAVTYGYSSYGSSYGSYSSKSYSSGNCDWGYSSNSYGGSSKGGSSWGSSYGGSSKGDSKGGSSWGASYDDCDWNGGGSKGGSKGGSGYGGHSSSNDCDWGYGGSKGGSKSDHGGSKGGSSWCDDGWGGKGGSGGWGGSDWDDCGWGGGSGGHSGGGYGGGHSGGGWGGWGGCYVNADPVFLDDCDACIDVTIDENTLAVIDLDATDADGDALTYAISGGDDAAFFTVDPATGELSFIDAPDFEAPLDADGDNVYEVKVSVSDGEGGSDEACVKVEVADVDDTPPPSGGDACHFTLSQDGLDIEVFLTELPDGSVKIDVSVADDSAKVGDLRGLFFHVADEDKIRGLTVTGDDVTDSQFSEDRVKDLGNGANVSGLGRYDAGVEFGTSGIGKDDIRSTSFVISHPDGMSLDDFRYQDFAVRLTSVGYEGGARCDSEKIGGNAGELPCGGGAEANSAPIAEDDLGGLCSYSTTTIDVLLNDSDADPDEVWGLVGLKTDSGVVFMNDGDSHTLDSGAVVTRVGDAFEYDLSGTGDDFDKLLVGQKGADFFEYVISDDEGATDIGRVDIDVCGGVNAVELIDNENPLIATLDLAQVIDPATFLVGTVNAAVDFDEAAATTLLDLGALGLTDHGIDGLFGPAYCVDRTRPANYNATDALVYTSTGDLPDTNFDGGDVVDKEENLDNLNWLLSQRYEDQGYTYTDIQSAIWQLMDDVGGIDTSRATPGIQLSAAAQTMYDAAMANGDGFVPTGANGDVLGLIFQPVSDNGSGGYDANGQVFVVGYDLQDCLCY